MSRHNYSFDMPIYTQSDMDKHDSGLFICAGGFALAMLAGSAIFLMMCL